MTALEASQELSALASLPFYCSLLLELYRAKGRMPSDRLELLDFVVERMMDREHGKGVFRWRDFIAEDLVADALAAEAEAQGIRLIDGLDAGHAIASVLDAEGRRNLLEVLGAIAHQRCRTVGGEEAGALDAETIRGFLGASYASETSADGGDRALLALVQFAFFGASRQGGLVDFTHAILAEYLAGTYAVAMLEAQAEARSEGRSSAALALGTLRQALGNKELVAGSVFADVLRRAIAGNPSLKSFVGELADSGDARLTADAGLLLRR